MSHAIGAVKFQDGQIKFYEYNGTVDYAISHIYDTTEEVSANWRKYDEVDCTCGGEEPVSIYTSYGKGYYFEGCACKTCKSLSHEYDFDIIERSETEDWALQVFVDY